VRHVLIGRSLVAQGDRPYRAAEDETGHLHGDGGIERVPQSVDVGGVQRRRVPQPGPGVHDAVVQLVNAAHDLAEGLVVGQLSPGHLDVQVLERPARAGRPDPGQNPIAPGDQLPGDVGSHEARGSHDK